MAIVNFNCKGYGQIEPSQVWFTRSGMSESQCEFNTKEFKTRKDIKENTGTNKVVGENGVFYIIDKDAKKVFIPNKAMSDMGYKMGINYSSEYIYDERTPGRRNFYMVADEHLPRLGFVEPGMRICTNAICWDDANLPSELSSLLEGDIEDPSLKIYDGIKKYIDAKNEGDGTSTKPLYLVVTPESKGRLCLTTETSKALGGIYAQITQAYTNADRTLSFKIMFINEPTA